MKSQPNKAGFLFRSAVINDSKQGNISNTANMEVCVRSEESEIVVFRTN